MLRAVVVLRRAASMPCQLRVQSVWDESEALQCAISWMRVRSKVREQLDGAVW